MRLQCPCVGISRIMVTVEFYNLCYVAHDILAQERYQYVYGITGTQLTAIIRGCVVEA